MAYGSILGKSSTTWTNEQILSSSDATLLGLSSTATPSDMFNILANVGNLYVWKRTTSSGTDYPVSTNPNAYQEESDAQPAGYTLGEVVNKQTNIVGVAYTSYFYYSDTLPVNENGTVNVSAMTRVSIAGQNRVSEYNGLYLGKFIMQQTADSPSDLPLMTPVFVPQDATFTYNSVNGVGISKYQKVTTYPAIPARTTIEYMGQVGDKDRIVTGSYVGTGTYGKNNPNTLTFESTPKIIFVFPVNYNAYPYSAIFYWGATAIYNISSSPSKLIISYTGNNSISWYDDNDDVFHQMNYNGITYTYIAML